MDSPRYTSISRKTLVIPDTKRHSSRSLNPSSQPTYRSKTPQPPAPSRPKSTPKSRKYAKRKPKKAKTGRRLIKYRARKDSQPEKEIEEELPDYVKATTPQPHMTNHNPYPMPPSNPIMPLQRSKSGHNVYTNNINESPHNIPQFSPINSHSNSSTHSAHNNNYNNGFKPPMPLHPMSIIHSNNTTPIPMAHNSLPPHGDEFNTNKIRQIPKPQPPPSQQLNMRRGSNSSTRARADSGISMSRPRADSGMSIASINSESHTQFSLLSPKQMEDQIMSHYSNRNSVSESTHTRKKTPYKEKISPKDKENNKKWGFLSKNSKKRNSKSKKHSRKRNSKSESKPFNDEDDIIMPDNNAKRNSIEKEQIFVNKLHPEYTPLAPPKSQPPQNNKNNWQNIPPLPYNPMQSPHSYILPMQNEDRTRSNSIKSDKLPAYTTDNIGRNASKTVGNYEDHNEFMDDKEVAQKSFKYNQTLTQGRFSPQSSTEKDMNVQQMNREMDKMTFRCDQLDWNLSTLQTNTDKDIRQVTAKIHRVEHDMRTQKELNNSNNMSGRKNEIFNSLDSSIGAVMRNVESIKHALQTLDLRMSIINQRQHDIFKHIDETKDLLENTATIQKQEPLHLHAMEKSATLSSRRASLQSMSEMLKLQCTRSMSIKTEEEHQQYMSTISESKSGADNTNNNPLILPTYDDNEDILNPQSMTNKKLRGHIRPELLIQNNGSNVSLISQKSTKVSYKSSGDYTITIERTQPQYVPQQQQVEENENENNNKLDSIVELDDDDSSTESMLSQERNTAPISIPPMDDEMNNYHKQTSLSRRSHRRSDITSGLSDQIMSAIKSETMIVYSSDSSDTDETDEKAMENDNVIGMGDDVDEEKQYIINKENRRKRNESRSKKSKRNSHSRSINVSMGNDNGALHGFGSTINNIDMKTLEVPIENEHNNNRKYSESYSINVNAEMNSGRHNKNMSTHTTPIGMLKQFKTNKRTNVKQKTKASEIFNIGASGNDKMKYNNVMGVMDKRRTGSMSYDIGKEPNITYERELSVRTDDPLGLKGIVNDPSPQPLVEHENENESESDSVSELSIDSMSDLSGEDNGATGTFVVNGDTLAQALALQEEEQEEEEHKEKEKENRKEKSMKKKKKSKSYIQLMNCKFILHIVPNKFTIINDFIVNELSKKPSYVLSVCNNTTSHDLFFKTSYIYKSKSKCLRYFREMSRDSDDFSNNSNIISIDSNDNMSDDHLAPMEHMIFGDINIKKGYSYSGYFVFEAYPFPNIDNDNGMGSEQTALITPNANNNPLTPQLKTHKILEAIDEKHKTLTKPIDFTQLDNIKLGQCSPSTVNKYRRQSMSTSRRTSFQFQYNNNTMSINEHSVTTLLDKALEEEHQSNNYPWNDDLDDLMDIIIGYNIELSIGDPELNTFKCYIQFNKYSQPIYYQTQLNNNCNKLKEFCNGGADGLKLMHNELCVTININYKNTIHPQIVFNIGYNQTHKNHIVQQPNMNETLDID